MRGTDGTPGENGKTPVFKIENDILYWKYTTEETWTSLGKVKGDKGDQGDPGTPGEPGTPGTPGANALSNVADNGTYYTITYSDNTVVNVQKWISASNVTIEFFDASLSNLTNLTTPITELSVAAEKTILYRVNGSASGTTMPTVMATSEGGYVISCAQPTSLGSSLGNVGQITITPTYAFTTGAKNGRVIVFIDYYGTTIMKELILKGTANVDVYETITVEASQGSVEIDLADLGLNARPALGFSYNYTDFVDRTGQSDNFVYAEKVGANTDTDKWISRGTGASAYDNTTKKETLTIGANPTNKWRAGMVVVYPSKNSQAAIAHIKIIQKPGETNLANPDNSGADDPANCYVISEPGRYLIPTYKGTNNSQTYDFTKIDTPISDGTGITISSPEKVVRNGKQYISFDVNMSQDGMSDVVNNNSMIVIRDGDNVVWSWHLWFTSGVENSDYGILGGETYNTNATMLNRNIGAAAARNTGLYYKWGDKDPYFTTTGGSADYHGGTEGGSWIPAANEQKALTDPCPPGYKVPSVSVWNAKKNAATVFGSDYFTYEGSPLVLYPYSGYMDENNDYKGQSTSDVSSNSIKDEIVGTYEVPSKGDKSTSLTGLNAPRRYRNVVYKLKVDVNSGLAHAVDGYFIYGYSHNGLDNLIDLVLSDKCTIISCERQVGTLVEGTHYTVSGRVIKTYTYTGVEPNWNGSWETLDADWFNSGSGTAAIARPLELTNLKMN